MDHKLWLGRRRVSEKTIVAADEIDITLKQTDEMLQRFPRKEEIKSERVVKNLSEKLASVLLDCHPKDNQLKIKQAKPQEEDDKGQEKPEARSVVLKEERQQRTDDDNMKSLSKLEMESNKFEDDLRKAKKSIERLAAENSYLNKALLVKEKLIEDLHKQKSQKEVEFHELMTRLDAAVKENTFLKYEFRVLEKELEIRSEEMEYNRRPVEALRKQHFESVKKITELEAECERLRLLMRKRVEAPQTRRKKSNPSRELIVRENPIEKITLIEKLHDVEKENKTLKEIVTMKSTELQVSRMMYSRTASRLSHVEAQLKEMTNLCPISMTNLCPISGELSMVLGDNGSDDGISCSGSWASALISELENFRDGKLKNQREYSKSLEKVSDMRLLDDFAEMEKLAIVSTEIEMPSDKTSKELVTVIEGYSNSNTANQESFDWIQVVLTAILKQKHISKRSLDELLNDIRIALGCTRYPFNSYMTSKSPKTSPTVHTKSDLDETICKIIELIERFNVTSSISYSAPDNFLEKEMDSLALEVPVHYYSVHVFQWKNSELSAVLQKLISCCSDVLKGKADFRNLFGEFSAALDWVVNNCVAPENASSARNKIRKHFGWNESKNENKTREKTSSLHSNSPLRNPSCLKDENMIVKYELQREHEKSKEMMIQLCEMEENIKKLKDEVDKLKKARELVEDDMENQKTINEDLDTQLTVTRAKLNEVSQKFSSLEVELEYKNSCCEELEATCLELQLQLESSGKKGALKCDIDREDKQQQNGSKVEAASVKLAECQGTILSLGKQLKALASPREAALFDKVFSSHNSSPTTADNKGLHKRFSLRDQMQVEDVTKAVVTKSPENEGTLCLKEASNPSLMLHAVGEILGSKNRGNNDAFRSLAVVQSKKRGVGFLMKLLLRRKKGSHKKSLNL